MKQDIHHQDFRPVVFRDSTNGFMVLTRSTATSTQTVKWEDGNEYPLVEVYISSASHPFYTGKEKLVDIEGRVDRFKAKAEHAAKLRSQAAAKAAKQQKRSQADKPSETTKLGAKPSNTKAKKDDTN